MLFNQVNTYTKRDIREDEKNKQLFNYRRFIQFHLLSNVSSKKVFYDKELKIHFESPEVFTSYEIEVLDPIVVFDKRYAKAADFQRRLQYKYDWLQIKKGSSGSIEILNKEYVQDNFKQLKNRLLNEYKGAIVETYLKRLSGKIEDKNHFEDILNQYTEYGLFFVPVGKAYVAEKSRFVFIDDNPKSKLVETIELFQEDEKYALYNLYLKPLDGDNRIKLIDVEGKVKWNKEENTIEIVDVKIKYTYDDVIINEWALILLKENEIK